MIDRKKKPCIQCGLDKYIWAYGRCKGCDRKVNLAVKKTKKKEKGENISELKKKLDEVFSKYIRLRNADENGMVKCFTSDKIMHWKDSHAGHFISRRHLSTRWNEINVQVQSVAENIFNQGNAPEFGRRIISLYGADKYEELYMLSKYATRYTRFFYETMIQEYTNKVNELMKKL